MKAIVISNYGPQAQLDLRDCLSPTPGPYELCIRVKAAGVNRADILQKRGHYPPPPGASPILGLEASGIVQAIGEKVTQFKPGDAVWGLLEGGGYAEYCLMHESLATLKSPTLTFVEAAAIAEALVTVHATVFELGKLKAHERFLVHGAGSGIGSFAIQMAKLKHAEVISTVGTPNKIDKALALGALQVFCYQDIHFFETLGDNTFDVILDFIGGDYLNWHLNALKTEGRLIQIACMKKPKAEISFVTLIQKRLQLQGFTLRSQPLAQKSKLWKLALNTWGEKIASGELSPIIDSIFPLAQATLAHQRIESQAHFGKIILESP